MKSSTLTPVPGITLALNLLRKHFEPLTKARRQPIDTIDIEITRDFKTFDVIVEILEATPGGWPDGQNRRHMGEYPDNPDITLGIAYDTRGREWALTLEERAEAEKKWSDLMEWRATHLKD